jgi:nitroreductase
MTTMEALLGRRSIRKYRPDSVPKDLIRQILDAGLYAANGGGHQIPHFIVLNGREKVRDFSEIVRAELALFDESIYLYESGTILKSRSDPDFDCSYGAPVMILAAAPHAHGNSMADCCCSVQNMPLSACVRLVFSLFVQIIKSTVILFQNCFKFFPIHVLNSCRCGTYVLLISVSHSI